MIDGRGVWRATGVMTAGTALSRITGLVRVAALAYALGVTGDRLADTYNLANTTPNIIYELFLGGIVAAVFVPSIVEMRERREGDPSALVTVSLTALAIVAVLTALGAPLIMRVYTFRVEDPAVRAAQLELATFLLRWFAPQIFFYALSGIAQAFLNVRGRFGPTAFVPVINNLISSATFFAYAAFAGRQTLDLTFGEKTLLGAGTTLGVVAQALVLLPYLRGEGWRFNLDLRDPAVTKTMRRAAYVVGYVLVNQAGLWIVLALANGVRGGVTSWQVAFIFFQLPHGLFGVSLHTALLPDLSRAAAAAQWDAFRRSVHVGVRGVAYLLIPSAIGYILLAGPVTRLILARGVAGPEDAASVAVVLQAFACGLVFFSAFQLLTRSFYSLGDTRTPAALNAAAVAVQAALSFPLFAALGVRGLAFAHAVAYATGATLLFVVLTRRVPGGLRLSSIAPAIARVVVVATAMGAGVWIITRVLHGDIATVAVGVSAGAILYLAFSQVAGVEEGAIVLNALRRNPRGGRT